MDPGVDLDEPLPLAPLGGVVGLEDEQQPIRGRLVERRLRGGEDLGEAVDVGFGERLPAGLLVGAREVIQLASRHRDGGSRQRHARAAQGAQSVRGGWLP